MHHFSPNAKNLIHASNRKHVNRLRRRAFVNRKIRRALLEDDHPFYFHADDPFRYA